jgi:hypothetical protein
LELPDYLAAVSYPDDLHVVMEANAFGESYRNEYWVFYLVKVRMIVLEGTLFLMFGAVK